jgi:hypothetical protein
MAERKPTKSREQDSAHARRATDRGTPAHATPSDRAWDSVRTADRDAVSDADAITERALELEYQQRKADQDKTWLPPRKR